MSEQIKSKHVIVSRPPYELYMAFADMRNFLQFLPEDKKKDIIADYDSLTATLQGFNVGIKVSDRIPYSKIELNDNGAPFSFNISIHFDAVSNNSGKTDFYIEFNAELNLMMKMMLGSKLKDAMDKIADGLAAASEGRLPEGVDPSVLEQFKDKFKNR